MSSLTFVEIYSTHRWVDDGFDLNQHVNLPGFEWEEKDGQTRGFEQYDFQQTEGGWWYSGTANRLDEDKFLDWVYTHRLQDAVIILRSEYHENHHVIHIADEKIIYDSMKR